MYCQSCGKQIPDDSRFCRFCGTRQVEPPSESAPSSVPPAPPPVKLIVPESAPAPRRPAPVAPAVAAAPVAAAPVAAVAAAAPAPVVSTSGEWDYADFVVSFAGRKMPALRVNGLAGKNMDEAEARKLFWQTYQSEISMKLEHWTALGWQPTTLIGQEALEMRRFSGYKDKTLLYWILMLIAAIPSVGISLIVALIPSTFVEPTRFIAKLRAPHGTPLP